MSDEVPEFNITWKDLGLAPIPDCNEVGIYSENGVLLRIYNIVAEGPVYNVEDGPEVDILKALAHKQISLNTAIEVLGGIKWDRNNTKESQ